MLQNFSYKHQILLFRRFSFSLPNFQFSSSFFFLFFLPPLHSSSSFLLFIPPLPSTRPSHPLPLPFNTDKMLITSTLIWAFLHPPSTLTVKSNNKIWSFTVSVHFIVLKSFIRLFQYHWINKAAFDQTKTSSSKEREQKKIKENNATLRLQHSNTMEPYKAITVILNYAMPEAIEDYGFFFLTHIHVKYHGIGRVKIFNKISCALRQIL